MHCPKCQKPLKKRMIDSHEIDECAKCQGTWFDREALRKVKDQADPDLNWMDFDLLETSGAVSSGSHGNKMSKMFS